MTTQNMIVILAGMLMATIGALLYLAIAGNVIAVAILFGGWSILCVFLGWGFSILQTRQAAAKEQHDFMANAKENLAIMGAMQTVQNRQNQTLMSQLSTAARLPQPGPGGDSLVIDAAIFDELESGL